MKTSKRFSPVPVAARRLPSCVSRSGVAVLVAWAALAAPCFAGTALAASGSSAGSAAVDKSKAKNPPHPATTVVRIAEGQVVDGGKKPLAGAIVYLENPTSLDIKSYLTDTNGHFHFTQLAPQTDYEVWAEQNGTQSKHKFISQFNSHTHYDFTLTLDPNKKKKLLGIL